MKRLLLIVLLPAALAVSGFAVYRLQEPKTLAAEDFRAVLKELNLKSEEEKDEEGKTTFLITKGEDVVDLFQYGGTGDVASSIQIRVAYEVESKPKLEVLNAWNRDRRYTKAYLGSEGEVVLEQDLDLATGVDKAAVKKFIKDFMDAMPTFQKEIEESQ